VSAHLLVEPLGEVAALVRQAVPQRVNLLIEDGEGSLRR
jgi:hypothetical protein